MRVRPPHVRRRDLLHGTAEEVGLARFWARGFDFGGRTFLWGTPLREVAAASELTARDGSLSVPRTEAHGLPTVMQFAYAPHAERPVWGVAYELAPELDLQDDERLAALRASLDEALGPGRHAWLEKQPDRAVSTWQAGSATVRLTAFRGLFGFQYGKVTGRLNLDFAAPVLATPYLLAFRARDAPWQTGPGTVESFHVCGMRGLADPPWRQGEVLLALRRPELRATPAWVVEALGRHQVGIWRHPDSGACGLATETYTVLLPVAFDHERLRPARGPGMASLDVAGGHPFVVSEPGCEGLDALAARLHEMGVRVDRREDGDWN